MIESMGAAAYRDLMHSRSNKADAASHHSGITGASLGERRSGGPLQAAAGVKHVWLRQSLCQCSSRLAESRRNAVGRR